MGGKQSIRREGRRARSKIKDKKAFKYLLSVQKTAECLENVSAGGTRQQRDDI